MNLVYDFALGSTLFCFAALAFYFLLQMRTARAGRRLAQITEMQPVKGPSLVKVTGQRLMKALTSLRLHLGIASNDKLAKRFAAAGMRKPDAAEMYLTVRILAPILGVIAGTFVHTNTFLAIVVLAAAGYLGPDLWLERQIKSRRHRIHRSMPDAVDLLVICVDAGLGLDQAMLRVGQELAVSHPEINQEFLQINREQRAGRPRLEAWQEMAERTQLPDVQNFVSMLVQTERFGTPIARALNAFSDGMRLQRKQQAEEKAAKTSVKLLFPLVLFIFPCIFIVLLGPAAITIVKTFSQLKH
ncbi:MAG: type II secretion system F family protein [Acidobacteria bacterium]|jgi:tight adherence protein C|nr:type II secretion system F family protein [Acidobacteriota bacterium]